MTSATHEPIAVVGMHGRFPAAADLKAFWENLLAGEDVIGQVPAERWRWQDYDEQAAGEESTYSHRAGFMPFVDRFDHRFFGILPREAQTMDPQQRLFLQAAWGALEDAGYAPSRLAGSRVGVFVGVGHADYPALLRRDGVPSDPWRGTGIALTAIANRVSFALDLHGPSESIDTACSSSLVAIHRASQALQLGECDLAIVGGVNLLLSPELFIAFSKAGMLSKAGRCHTFDADADGYVRGEGVAALVLAPMSTARTNGDFVYGQICGSAVNHGGRAHSFTAPNPKAQAEVIAQAWQRSGYALSQACLVEAHGTGTPLGDPVEVKALKQALAHSKASEAQGTESIALGALKSHIGHLEAAAGIASVIKTLLSLQQGHVIGNLNYRRLNPHIELDDTPLYLPTGTQPLPRGGEGLAGVSSFGFGGVNAHVVLKAHRQNVKPAPSADEPWLILLSAKNLPCLEARVQQLLGVLPARRSATPGHLQHDLLARLRRALHLGHSEAGQSTPLASLGITPAHFVMRLREAVADLAPTVDIHAWRGAVTVEEVAERMAAATDETPSVEHAGNCPVLPDGALADAGLGSVARSLLEGRDAMGTRLAFVTQSWDHLSEVLSRFLAHPGGEQDEWFTPASTVPGSGDLTVPMDERGTAEYLKCWAAHWATSKTGNPEWETLYGGRLKPKKIPLPAYPFALERVWYPPSQASSAGGSAAGPVEAWNACWAPTMTPPSSVMGLAVLLRQALEDQTPSVSWTSLQFGTPQSLSAQTPISCKSASQSAFSRVQVMADGHALVQAQLQPHAELVPAAETFIQGSAHSADSFYAALATRGLHYSQAGRRVKGVRSSPTQLLCELAMPCQNPVSHHFWAALLSTLIGALTSLSCAQQLVLPYRIGRIALVRHRLSNMAMLEISQREDTGLFDVCAFDHTDALALSMEGVELRAARLPLTSPAGQVGETL